MNKRTAFWQIWVPLILIICIVGAAAFFLFKAGSNGGSQLAQWSDAALIYLLVPVIGCSFLFLVLGIALIFLVNSSHKKLHEWLGIAEVQSERIKHTVQAFCQKAIIFGSGPSEWLKNHGKVDRDGREKEQ